MKWNTPHVRRVLSVIIAVELFFLIPLLAAGLLWYSSYASLRSGQLTRAAQLQAFARPFFFISKTSYALSRLPLVLLRLAGPSDRLMRIGAHIDQLAGAGTHAALIIQESIPIVLKRDKTAGDIILLRQNMKTLNADIPQIDESMKGLAIELPKSKLPKLTPYTSLIRAIIQDEDQIFGVHKPSKYLLLFLNNKELRPGGGFIGSYAVVTIQYYTLLDIEIQDVYTADGQLKVHLDPHPAVAKYLGQPDGYLRDSNFSPDWVVNAELAKRYLYESLKTTGIDGVIGITTTALEYAVGAYGKVYLPDFKQEITQYNVYQKTQESVEKDFFPGSRQKKSFLSSLANTMRITFDLAPPTKLFEAFDRGVREKHLVAALDAPHVSAALKQLRFDGRQHPATYDYVMPVEANVGINKSNFFVKRRLDMTSDVSNPARPKRTITMTYENVKRKDTVPTDGYRMFFQLYLPSNVTIQNAKVDGATPVDYDVKDEGGYRIASMYVTVAPLKKSVIQIEYTSEQPENKNGDYSVYFEKQIGLDQMEVVHTYIPPTENAAISGLNGTRQTNAFSLLYDRKLTF